MLGARFEIGTAARAASTRSHLFSSLRAVVAGCAGCSARVATHTRGNTPLLWAHLGEVTRMLDLQLDAPAVDRDAVNTTRRVGPSRRR